MPSNAKQMMMKSVMIDISAYQPNKCFFYGLKNRGDLERFLFLKQNQLRKADSLILYRQSCILKRSGGLREINNPSPNLKRIQRMVLAQLRKLELPDWLYSGVKRKSYIDNAKHHIGYAYMIKIDIENFYPNCKSIWVYKLFVEGFKTSSDIAGIFTKLLTHNQTLPTGTPTSQLIAFLAYNNMFSEIYENACKYGFRFSLYVDDMTFSSNNEIPSEFINEIQMILNRYGHKLNMKKVKEYYPTQDKLTTGAVITKAGKLAVPNRQRQLILADLNELKVLLSTAKSLSSVTRNEINQQLLCKWRVATGRLQSARQIESALFPSVKVLYDQVRKYLKQKHLI